jgi:hypothetical protein
VTDEADNEAIEELEEIISTMFHSVRLVVERTILVMPPHMREGAIAEMQTALGIVDRLERAVAEAVPRED